MIEDEIETGKQVIESTLTEQRTIEGPVSVTYHDHGKNKIIYKVENGDQVWLAVGLERENAYNTLPREHRQLQELYSQVPEYFAKPEGLLKNSNGQMILLMEYLPHKKVSELLAQNDDDDDDSALRAVIAHSIGYATGFVLGETGQYTTEPHDGNILVMANGDSMEVKFVDVDHFKTVDIKRGTLDEIIELFLSGRESAERLECLENPDDFRNGVMEGFEQSKSGIN